MYVHVRVTAGVKKETVVVDKPQYFHISVREKAERNQANNRVVEILRAYFHTRDIRLVSGHTSPSKLFSVGE